MPFTDLVARAEFCETIDDLKSTVQEAEALSRCIQEHHWPSASIMTSNHHTRQAQLLWRKMTNHDAKLHIWVEEYWTRNFQQP
jgi:hypothetical protein